MSTNNILSVIAVLLLIAGGAYWFFTQVPQDTTGVANPASVYCVENLGGTVEIVGTAEGQIGVCHLPDGDNCEEWTLFRDGVCKPAPQP